MKSEIHLRVETVSLVYRKPFTIISGGVKQSMYHGEKRYLGQFKVGGSSGTLVTLPNECGFILTVNIYSNNVQIWVASIFRTILGKKTLSAKIKQELIDTRPPTVYIIEVARTDNAQGFELSELSARDWLKLSSCVVNN